MINVPQPGLTPRQAAAHMGKSVQFIMALIDAGELESVRDERKPGTTSPRYFIPQESLDAWRQSRVVNQAVTPVAPLPNVPRAFAQRQAARQLKARTKMQNARGRCNVTQPD